MSLHWAIREVVGGRASGITLTAAAGKALAKFCDMLDVWTGTETFMGAEMNASLADLTRSVVDESGLREMYRKQADTSGDDSDEDRLSNMDEMISAAADFEVNYDPAGDPFADFDLLESGEPISVPPMLALLRAYLERVALVADADAVDPESGAVTLMTLHAAKGLEFNAVAMIGLEEQLLPHARSNGDDDALEEERRLAFVGITRARERLLITSAQYRTQRGVAERTIPSRFLDELPAEHVSVTDKASIAPWDRNPSRRAASHDDDGDSPWGDATPESWGEASVQLEESREGLDWKAKFPPGSTVRHPQFGRGVIVTLTGGKHTKARVKFMDAGEKTLLLEYARLTRLG